VTGARDRLPILTLAALFFGYACCYFHRADLSVLAPLYAEDPGSMAMAAALADIASLGMLVYACGKIVGGVLADRFGGRVLFVAALAGAALAEFLALQSRQPVTFAAFRVLGMASLSMAWPSLGQVVSEITPVRRLATVMAFLSQSYLLGDATVRAVLAAVVAGGGGPAAVLGTATAGLAAATVVVGVVLVATRDRKEPLREGPRCVLEPAPPAGHGLRRAMVWFAAMNLTLALVRESLSLWGPGLLVELSRMTTADAVRASAVLPIASAIGALLAGPLADRGARTLFWVTFAPALGGAVVLGALATGATAGSPFAPVVALALACGLLAMPVSLASGVLPLRAGAGRSATMLGLVDGAGSFGAVLAGSGFARVLGGSGTRMAFAALAVTAIGAAACAVGAARSSRALRSRA
jgi:sugar phosphate permease